VVGGPSWWSCRLRSWHCSLNGCWGKDRESGGGGGGTVGEVAVAAVVAPGALVFQCLEGPWCL
jgi:hypothetical protein